MKDIAFDCDGDTLLIAGGADGAACHEGYKSCFFRSVGSDGAELRPRERAVETPEADYGRRAGMLTPASYVEESRRKRRRKPAAGRFAIVASDADSRYIDAMLPQRATAVPEAHARRGDQRDSRAGALKCSSSPSETCEGRCRATRRSFASGSFFAAPRFTRRPSVTS